MQSRAYRGESDQPRMYALARQCAESALHWIDLPYRFSSWALDDPHNACLWRDDFGALVAWAALQTPFWCIDFALHPAREGELLPQVLAWADRRISQVLDTPYGHPAWFVNVFERQKETIAILEQAGFTSQAEKGSDSWSKVWLSRPAHTSFPSQSSPQVGLPPGFTLRPLAGPGEVGAYVALHQEVFETRNMTDAWRLRTLSQPDYRPELDLVIEAPDGSLAAFCVLWLAESSPGESLSGQVEPMGVSPRFRHKGLGKALLTEGLRRLEALGAVAVYVETDDYRNAAMALYESVGFRIKERVLVLGKEYTSSLLSSA